MIDRERGLDAVGAQFPPDVLHARIVYDQLDARPASADLRGRRANGGERGKIAANRAARVASECHDGRAAPRQLGGRGLTDAAARAGNDAYVR